MNRMIAIVSGLALTAATNAHADRLERYLQMDLSDLMQVKTSVSTLFPEPLISAPGSVTVVTAQQIRDRGYRHLGELLTDLPGVDVSHYADGVALDVVSFRGVAGNNKILILQDGVRINSPSGAPIAIANNFPLYHLKQVEVISGPGSAIYGADAFAGVINLVTRNATEHPGGELLVERGQYDTGYTHFSLHQELAQGLALSLGGHQHDSDNPDLSKHYPVEFPHNGRSDYHQPTQSHSFNAKLAWNDTLVLGYSRSYMRNPTSAGAPSSFVDYGADYRTLIQTAYAKLSKRLGDGLAAEFNVDHSEYEVEPESEFVNLFTSFLHEGYKYAKGKRTKFEPRLSWEFGTQKILAGISYEEISVLPKTANLPSPYNGSTLYYPNTDDNLPIKIFHVDEENWGAFLQINSHWNEAWTTTLGARYDSHSTYGESFSPRASINYSPERNTNWEVSYAESFLAPSVYHRFENYGSFVGDTDSDGLYNSWFMHVPNPDLEPELLRAIEISVNHQATPRLVMGASLYHHEVEGIVTATATPTPQTDFVPGGEIAFSTHAANVGRLSATGLELTSSYMTELFGAEAQFWGGAAYVRGDIEEFGISHDLPYTSNWKLKGGLTLNWNGKYLLSPRLHWIGPSNGGVDTNGIDAGTHTVVHLHGRIRNFMTKGLELQATINNLFDSRYYEPGDGGSGLDAVPQDPRRINLALSYRF